jgi:hypothetical protein
VRRTKRIRAKASWVEDLILYPWEFRDADELRGWRPDPAVPAERPGNPMDMGPRLTALKPDEAPLTTLLRSLA